MTEVSKGQIQIASLDHLGLVAAVCQDLNIAQRIDDRLHCHSQRKISPGRAVVAMILNGLGFTNRRLYRPCSPLEKKLSVTKLSSKQHSDSQNCICCVEKLTEKVNKARIRAYRKIFKSF